jgi:TusA-related sulfurtransferase
MPYLLTFANTHAAMSAADVLAEAGVAHRVIPRPVQLSGDCGVAVELADDAFDAADSALQSGGLAPVAVYEWSSAGSGEWVRQGGKTNDEGGVLMQETLDCRGMKCPVPVIETKKRLDALAAGELAVLVDQEMQARNVQRAAQAAGYLAETAEGDGHFAVTIRKGSG